jgi:hypothetical protein
MPLLLLFAISRLGYVPRAIWIQTLVALVVIPLGYWAADPSLHTNDAIMPRVDGVAFDRDFNLNWTHGFHDRPASGAAPWLTVWLSYPLLVHLPTHVLLSWLPWTRPRQDKTIAS